MTEKQMSAMYRSVHDNSSGQAVHCRRCRRPLWIKGGPYITKYGEGCYECIEHNPKEPPPKMVSDMTVDDLRELIKSMLGDKEK